MGRIFFNFIVLCLLLLVISEPLCKEHKEVIGSYKNFTLLEKCEKCLRQTGGLELADSD